ncbi:MAG: delta-60 repeat domain-containing protein, partial [Opitutaceae bacterium]
MSLAAAFPSSFRRLTAFFPALLAGLLAALPALAQPVSVNDGFNPDVDGTVFTVVAQPDGKLLVGGQFTSVGGISRSNLARLNADGSVDTAFNPSPNAPVRAVLVQRDNRVVIGGDFTTVQPCATGAAVTRNRLARLNADGSVDTAFNPNLGGQLQPQVHALLLQADNRIVAGGSFTSVQPNGAAAATTRNYLARFNADGTLDTAFNPNPNAMVLALALHVDNKILVGGGFTTLQSAGESAPTTRNRVARLNPSGTVDSEFNPNANNGVTSIAVQRDGKILLAGYFTTVQPPTDVNPAGRSRLARLNLDGTLDSEFYPRADGAVATVSVQSDGLIVVGGAFTAVWGQGATSVNRGFIARFKPDGSLDSAFAPALNGAVNAVAQQADGKLVIGGSFTRATPPGASSAVIRNRLARIGTDGSLDSNFELDAGGRILVSVTQADGKIVVGGSFTSVAGLTRNYVARLNADGTVDTTYAPNFNGRVYAMALQADGKVLVGGAFTEIGGETRRHLARLNPSGTIDSEFYPHFDGQVGTLVLQSDGKILVGGTFNTVTPGRSTTPETRANLVRLNADGTIDSAFDPNPNSTVAAIALQSDGKIIIGGLFSALRPGAFASTSASFVTRNFIARLNAADGKLDEAFK